MPIVLFFGLVNAVGILYPKEGLRSIFEALDGLKNIMMSVRGTFAEGMGAFSGDPLLIAGKVTERTIPEREWWPDGALVRLFFRFDLEVDAKRVVRIRRDKTAIRESTREVSGTVHSTRRLVRRLREGDEVVLVCNSRGRAVTTMTDVLNGAEANMIA